MPGQALFYERAVPVSVDRHREWCVQTGANFAYSRNTNSVPLTAVEFERAASEYPVVFSAAGPGEVVPVAILGLGDRQNLFISPDGSWVADYIPAFVRRYPFIFAVDESSNRFTLCIDESYSGCNQEGKGERLFSDEGQPSPFLSQRLGFLGEYQAQHQRTMTFTASLRQLGVLEPVRAEVSAQGGAKSSLSGFQVVSRDRLNALDDATLAGMVRTGQMDWIASHLRSLARFDGLAAKRAASAVERLEAT